MEEATIHEILNGGYVLASDHDLSLIISWDGRATFRAWREGEGPQLTLADMWTTDILPRDHVEALGRCQMRLIAYRAEAADADRDPAAGVPA